MISNHLEDPALDEPAAEKDKNVEGIAGAVRTGLESLQRKWEQVPDRDEEFLSEAEKLFIRQNVYFFIAFGSEYVASTRKFVVSVLSHNFTRLSFIKNKKAFIF